MTRMKTPVAKPDSITFDDAVDVAERIIQETESILIKPDPVPYFVAKCRFEIETGGSKPELASLLSSSQEDRVAHDSLRKLAGDLLDKSRPLPDPLRQWLAEYLLEKRSPPAKKKARKKDKNLIRNAGILRAMYYLKSRDMSPYRKAPDLHTSVADAVAEAVRKIETERKGSRARFSYSAAITVWQGREKQYDDPMFWNGLDTFYASRVWVEGRDDRPLPE